MKALINENNVVTTLLRAGYIEGAVDTPDDIPEDFEPYKYKLENGSFLLNPDYVPPSADISAEKLAKIEESKTKLAEWLANNPLLYSDGKYYSVTEEKQSLLNSNIASYERAKALGIEYPLKWNSTGEECTEWTYESLVTLSLTIAAYVAPKVSKQQSIEITIKSCETAEELDKVVISYD